MTQYIHFFGGVLKKKDCINIFSAARGERQPEEASGRVVEEQLSEIMNICVGAAQVATTCGELTLRMKNL